MAQAHMSGGARLAYVVVPQEGSVKRKVDVWRKGTGLTKKYIEEPAGFMVYFPRGHVLRLKDMAALKHYKLHKPATIVNLSGLNDPSSPLGKVMMAQDDAARAGAFANLEKQVMGLAQATSGKIELTRDASELEEEDA